MLLKKTSPNTAILSHIVLRESDLVRLIFIPEIIKNNPKDPKACVKGRFLYQKRKSGEQWVNAGDVDHKKLKAGEWTPWTIHSEELLAFMKAVVPIYKNQWKTGEIPGGETELIAKTPDLVALIKLGEELPALLSQDPATSGELLQRLLAWLSSKPKDEAGKIVSAIEALQVAQIASLANLASLKALQATWNENKHNSDEEFWQKTIERHNFSLSLVFPFAVVVLADKAYVGGKNVANHGGKIVDFLVASKLTGNCVAIELKTPATELLGGAYRGVYSISGDMSGALVQTQDYLQRLTQFAAQKEALPEGSDAVCPKGVIICGSLDELDTSPKRRAFELFRNSLTVVQVITFDEFFAKVDALVNLMESP